MADKKSQKQIAQENAKDAYYLGMKRAQGKGNLTNEINREIESNLPERGVRPFLSQRDPYYGFSGYRDEPQDEALTRAKAESNMQKHGFDKTDPRAEAAERKVQNLRDAKENRKEYGMKKGGSVKKYASGGTTEEKSLPRRMYEKVMGTPEQNAEAQRRMDERDRRNPDTIPAKVNRAVDKVIGRKAGGTVSSASSRADGCTQRGKTKGRMV